MVSAKLYLVGILFAFVFLASFISSDRVEKAVYEKHAYRRAYVTYKAMTLILLCATIMSTTLLCVALMVYNMGG